VASGVGNSTTTQWGESVTTSMQLNLKTKCECAWNCGVFGIFGCLNCLNMLPKLFWGFILLIILFFIVREIHTFVELKSDEKNCILEFKQNKVNFEKAVSYILDKYSDSIFKIDEPKLNFTSEKWIFSEYCDNPYHHNKYTTCDSLLSKIKLECNLSTIEYLSSTSMVRFDLLPKKSGAYAYTLYYNRQKKIKPQHDFYDDGAWVLTYEYVEGGQLPYFW